MPRDLRHMVGRDSRYSLLNSGRVNTHLTRGSSCFASRDEKEEPLRDTFSFEHGALIEHLKDPKYISAATPQNINELGSPHEATTQSLQRPSSAGHVGGIGRNQHGQRTIVAQKHKRLGLLKNPEKELQKDLTMNI